MTGHAHRPASAAPPQALEPRPDTPAQVWALLAAGNDRFVADRPRHPNQDAARRHLLTSGQQPIAAFFGCSDSRVAAEVIFDQGLGDLFVVRTAGHVVGPTELGSLEFAVHELQVPLIVVLGHDSCGAVEAARAAYADGRMPPGFLRDLVERLTPSVIAADRRGETSTDEIVLEHVQQTVQLLAERSSGIHAQIEAGGLGVLGLTYSLDDGRANVVASLGPVLDDPATPGPG